MSDTSGREVRLDALVNKLHAEGVSRGRAEAEEILSTARQEAREIRESARKEADAIIKAAESRAAEFQENAAASVRLAARDTQRALTHSVRELFERAFRNRVGAVLSDADFVRELIMKLAAAWAADGTVSIEVHPDLGEKLLGVARSGVGDMLDEGIEIRLNRSISNGFRIRREGDQVAYDFTDEAVVDGLKVHLNTALTELLES